MKKYRYKLKRSKSKKTFRKGNKVHKKNRPSLRRGGVII